jgi:hypothetical protein
VLLEQYEAKSVGIPVVFVNKENMAFIFDLARYSVSFPQCSWNWQCIDKHGVLVLLSNASSQEAMTHRSFRVTMPETLAPKDCEAKFGSMCERVLDMTVLRPRHPLLIAAIKLTGTNIQSYNLNAAAKRKKVVVSESDDGDIFAFHSLHDYFLRNYLVCSVFSCFYGFFVAFSVLYHDIVHGETSPNSVSFR